MRQHPVTKALHALDPVRRGQFIGGICASLWYHSSSNRPLAVIGLHRAVVIDFKPAHDHTVIVLLNVGAWVPLSTRPGVGLPTPGDQSSIEQSSNHAIGTICA